MKKYKLAIIDRPFEIPKLMKVDKMFGSRRVLKPHSGKTELAKERLRKASKIMVNNGANIDIFCCVLSAVGQEKIVEVRKKDA